jgi:energy-coupling factor transporter ATP-binding protein EcfA2
MTMEPAPTPNPFSTRFTRPGQLVYRFPRDRDVSQLCDQLQRQCWWGAIVGRHGSGKTTLLHSLQSELEHRGRQVYRYSLHAGMRRLPALFSAGLGPGAQVVIDGYEQLRCWTRYRIERRCRSRQAGLLVTTHRPLGVPELFSTHTSLEILQQLVQQLQQDHEVQVDSAAIKRCYDRYQGDIRETLFCLYDRYEQQSRAASFNTSPPP